MPPSGLMQIGEVAERTGLSLRTIRYYEEVGIVVPAARSQGGFRLYTDADVARLRVVKRMKPLDFSLEQTRELLDVLDRLAAEPPGIDAEERLRLVATLRDFHDGVRARATALEAQLRTAREFAAELTEHLAVLGQPAGAGR
ncbi:MerR family transcriptional regulator [Solwaraspora sp. WMMD406]|uniref:MerR family transcriptional regulator n=1 Tax=Solwaraspora sp. WMMD406 TaxID=3016095 RepID=UPI0024171952|nr:MerR family transcriptional regulator [Solwaraspora sp. WMMD406]MDG4765469.1 MerR family transcriptional regulator [Solwaraspora sp. WMMD406]